MNGDVVVVGGGPAGTSTAILLAERGVRVTLLDKARFPRAKPCAEYLNPEAMTILDRLSLLDAARDAGAAVFRGMRVTSPGGTRMTLDFEGDAGRHALGISRLRLDALAIERCRALGVDVLEGTRVRRVLTDNGTVTGVQAASGRERIDVMGRVVVGADGHHSTVSRLLGLDRSVRWPRRIGLAAHFESFPLIDEMGEMHVSGSGYCGVAPQERERVNVAMVVDMTAFERRAGGVERFFDEALLAYPGLAERASTATRVTSVRGVGPLARRVRQVSGDGYVLVGDAAGFFDPFTGEGIYDALRGGALAAEAIAAALQRGDTSAAAFAGYDAERRRAFASKRRAAWLVQAFVRSPRLMDYAVIRIARRPRVASTMTGVLGDYREAGVVLSPRFLWQTLRP
ncbi:MAG TPA: NAD(P)/FAD-dependent oxidoreductase [Thermomicrobiales bacterium]|nr:NAD(P)/FAD-dependent oxidoreductase [Thermomicrobiales bacterium]